jgi:phosphoribosyl-ATP pyrophosphohydrolase/phosphoribosyl-AMP cyclohydrolase/histidinol dehydrogenase
MTRLRRLSPADVKTAARRRAIDPASLAAARAIVEDVRERGEPALREHAERLGDLAPSAPLVIGREAFDRALRGLASGDRELLVRTASRIREFALAQRAALAPVDVRVTGGRAGHDVAAVERAGCYAPGGRFPLPSSVLMTGVTARAAGVREVWLASPRPTAVVLAAAAVAGVDALLPVGGAHAIAALAFGAGPVPPCDVVAGPGNRWVTAAKQLVAGQVGIDMLAGPSELVIVADRTADPGLVAADLLAQAEHDPDAFPVLVTDHEPLIAAVECALAEQLSGLPTAATAEQALANGCSVLATDLEEAINIANRLAPEHLQLLVEDASALPPAAHFGALFAGRSAAEVLGDYGAGPNHVLPTGATARFSGGLSVFTFLRVRTWLSLDDPAGVDALACDAARFARLEGLEAHARSAERRKA